VKLLNSEQNQQNGAVQTCWMNGWFYAADPITAGNTSRMDPDVFSLLWFLE